ncbi:MAG: T9SS type A sorting domain-containing protein [candidate division Zixibacteria bacterium]|nr:T9SS type A sorting domain-containing protein [candidate division Zixibacteria bacterium]
MKFKTEIFVIAAVLAIFVLFNIAGASDITDNPNPKLLNHNAEKHYPPITFDAGGPDGGGYYYIDSDDAAQNAPHYEWVDISGVGTPLFLGDDENQGPFELGFEFEFYGQVFTSLYVCSNGFASFTSTSTDYSNDPIPSGTEPNNTLAFWWDDFNPSVSGSIYFYADADNRRFILSYENVPYYSYMDSTGSTTCQVIINQDGTIFYQYAAMDGGDHGLNSSTVGIENGDGTIGTQYLYNQEGIHDEMAICFGFDPPIYGTHNVGPTAFLSPGGVGQVDDPITPEVTFTNVGAETETFSVRMIIERNGTELYNQTETITALPSGGSESVEFIDFTPDSENLYILTAISELEGDEDNSNDTLAFEYRAFNQIVYYDFESNGIFETSGLWEWGAPTSGPGNAHSGVNVWATALAGEYPNDSWNFLTTLPFGLSAGAVMSFWQWYNTEASWDGGNVKISTDGGSSFEVITPNEGYTGEANTSNPLSGEPIFTGHNVGEMWHSVTFDLAAYVGQSVIFRFDFGSDGSVTYPGWYIDDFTIMGAGGVEPGWVTGIVTENQSGDPIDGATVSTGGISDVTGNDGVYTLELFPGDYDITASADYHNPLTMQGVTIIEGDTVTQDFALTTPMMDVDEAPINVNLHIGDVENYIRTISNTGDGVLDFNISVAYNDIVVNTIEPSFADEPVIGMADASVIEAKNAIPVNAKAIACNHNSSGEPPVALDFGDEIAYFDLQGQCGDNQLLAAAFALDHFFVCGGNTGADPNNLYKFDRDGYLVETYNQGTSGWGWLDLCYDGTYLYGTDFDTDVISQVDPATGQVVGTVPNPTAAGLGIAYDPATDHFWGVNWFGTDLVEFDRSGTIINQYPQAPLASIFGIAWDNASADGPWLWCFSQETNNLLTVAQFDPINGYMTGVQFTAIDHDGGDMAGGLDFTTEYDPALGVLLCLGQAGVSDWLGVYEITETVNWLAIDPTSGSIDPGESDDIDITIDLTEIEDTTTYLGATLTVSSNSPVTGTIDITVDVIGGIEGEEGLLPSTFALEQNYPNPFNAITAINFAVPTDSDVELTVYNMLGQNVKTLISGKMNAGYHRVLWDASSVASGVYFYKLTAGDKTEVREMSLLK